LWYSKEFGRFASSEIAASAEEEEEKIEESADWIGFSK
jgi:hypothetical protein